MAHAHDTSPDEDVAIAQKALASGDLDHALHHVGSALASNPSNPQWFALQESILRRADDPMALTAPDDGHTDFVTAATRAHAHALRREWLPAINLIAQVVSVRPDVPYLAWADPWLRQPGVLQGDFDALMQSVLMPFARGLPGARGPQDPVLRNLHHASSMVQAICGAHPTRGFAWYVASALARKTGNAQQAVPLAQHAFAVEPSQLTAVAVAAALRDVGQHDAAIAAFRDCLRFDPENASPLVDIGDIYLQTDRLDEAERSYQEALAKEPNHAWAATSLALVRYKRSNSPQDRAALLAMRQRFPGDASVEQILEPIDPLVPFVNLLPPPGDSTAKPLVQLANMLADHPERGGGTVAITVTHPESPSVLTAFRLATAHTKPTTIDLKIEKVQRPDPRAPKAQVDFVAWTWDGPHARPGVGAPDPRLAEALAQIAIRPYHLEDWVPQAAALGAQLGAAWLPHLVGAMVNPPPPRNEIDAFEWVQRVQIAAALVIAHLDQGWAASARRRALHSLVLGPTDWITNAGLVALAALAKDDPEIRRDVEALFVWLEAQIPAAGHTCFAYPLVCLRLWLGPSPQDEARLRQKRAEIEAGLGGEDDEDEDDEDEDDEDDDEETYEGLNLAQYAEFCARRDAIVARKMQQGLSPNAMAGVWPELEALCREYEIEIDRRYAGPSAARIEEWDERINGDPELQREFFGLKQQAQMQAAGMVSHAAPAQANDPDPVVFPGQRVARLSEYVGLMRQISGGDMQGALRAHGLDMQSYMAVAQAWGLKLASDPVLNGKFAQAMGS